MPATGPPRSMPTGRPWSSSTTSTTPRPTPCAPSSRTPDRHSRSGGTEGAEPPGCRRAGRLWHELRATDLGQQLFVAVGTDAVGQSVHDSGADLARRAPPVRELKVEHPPPRLFVLLSGAMRSRPGRGVRELATHARVDE